MTPQFEPCGERARWRVLYDLLCVKEIGDILSYEEMGKALDLDPAEGRHTIQLAMRRAGKELERVDSRAISPVTNTGYRVVEPAEHMKLARKHQKRARNEIDRGHSKVTNVDLSQMDHNTRKSFELVAQAFQMQSSYVARLDVKQEQMERALGSVTQQSERTAEEVEELKERLRRLEEPPSE